MHCLMRKINKKIKIGNIIFYNYERSNITTVLEIFNMKCITIITSIITA